MRKRKIVWLLCLSASPWFAFGQSFSLKQCIDYARSNNGNQKIAGYETAVAQKKVGEQIGTMLPQIDGSASYTDNLKLQTTLLPDFTGKTTEKVAIQMGTKHNLSAGIQLTQKVFDPTLIVALKAAKVNEQYSNQSQQKTTEQTTYNVSSTYYQTLVIAKRSGVLRATLAASEKLLASTELKFKNGMAKKIDVDKIRVSCNNTRSQLEQSELSYKQSLNMLKYQMGMPVDAPISLSDTTALDIDVEREYLASKSDLNIENRVDYQLQKTTIKAQELDKQRNVVAYLPTLNFTASYNYNAMRQKFNFFDGDQPWFNSYNIGFSLKVPIFDGLQKKSKIAQSRLNIAKAQENLHLTEQSIKVNVSNYEIQYKNAIDNIRNEKENLDLAQNVYANTQMQYNEGISTALELVQAESSLRESQNTYFNKLFTLFIARLDLEQSKGTLTNYINNIK